MSTIPGIERQRATVGRLLCYGSLALTVAISLSFVTLEITRMIQGGDVLSAPLFGNAVIAAVGVAVGTVYGRGIPGRRLTTSLVAGTAGVLCYAGFLFVGLVCVVTAHNAIR